MGTLLNARHPPFLICVFIFGSGLPLPKLYAGSAADRRFNFIESEAFNEWLAFIARGGA